MSSGPGHKATLGDVYPKFSAVDLSGNKHLYETHAELVVNGQLKIPAGSELVVMTCAEYLALLDSSRK